MLDVKEVTRPDDAIADYARSNYAEVVSFFDEFAGVEAKWRRRNATYHRLIAQIMGSMVPQGQRVLDIGTGAGALLAAVRPDEGVGIALSPAMVELARERHPHLRFAVGA